MGEPEFLDVPGYDFFGGVEDLGGRPDFVHYGIGMAVMRAWINRQTTFEVLVPVGSGDSQWVPVDAETGEAITHVKWADARLGVYCGSLPDSRSEYRLIRRPLRIVRRSEVASLSSR